MKLALTLVVFIVPQLGKLGSRHISMPALNLDIMSRRGLLRAEGSNCNEGRESRERPLEP